VPDNAVLVSSPGSAVPVGTGILSVTKIDPRDKVSPLLGTEPPFIVIVEFHTDVTVDRQNTLALDEGLTLLRPVVLARNHAITTGDLGL